MKKLTNDIFLKKSNLKHNVNYRYPDIYINSNQKIRIICPKHGDFYQYPHHHILSDNPCKMCKKDLKIKKEFNSFKDKATKIHNNLYNYDYSNYVNNKIKIKIICSIHGEFYQRPDTHIYNKQGCPHCYGDTILTKKDFIDKSIIIHNNKYDYSLIQKLEKNVNIICKKHGIFQQRVYNHLNGQGCPSCNNSKGENMVETYLVQNNIKYIKQKKFENCKNKRKLPFDFYLPDLNTCIEYDGKYHFESEYIQNNDKIKNDFCNDNNINILRFNLSNIKNINIINDPK